MSDDPPKTTGVKHRVFRRFIKIAVVLAVVIVGQAGFERRSAAYDGSMATIKSILEQNNIPTATVKELQIPLTAAFSDFEGSALISFQNGESVIAKFDYISIADTIYVSFDPLEWGKVILAAEPPTP